MQLNNWTFHSLVLQHQISDQPKTTRLSCLSTCCCYCFYQIPLHPRNTQNIRRRNWSRSDLCSLLFSEHTPLVEWRTKTYLGVFVMNTPTTCCSICFDERSRSSPKFSVSHWSNEMCSATKNFDVIFCCWRFCGSVCSGVVALVPPRRKQFDRIDFLWWRVRFALSTLSTNSRRRHVRVLCQPGRNNPLEDMN